MEFPRKLKKEHVEIPDVNSKKKWNFQFATRNFTFFFELTSRKRGEGCHTTLRNIPR